MTPEMFRRVYTRALENLNSDDPHEEDTVIIHLINSLAESKKIISQYYTKCDILQSKLAKLTRDKNLHWEE